MDCKSPTIKPVLLKYKWPPAPKEEKLKTNAFETTRRNSKKQMSDEMVVNDIYGIEEKSGDEIDINLRSPTTCDTPIKSPTSFGNVDGTYENLYEELAEMDPRKSFVIPEDVETYETKVLKILNKNGAACKIRYLYQTDTERLTGPEALKIAVGNYMQRKVANHYDVEFLVNQSGIMLTDVKKRKFFRKHFPRHTISYCDIIREYQGVEISAKGMFAFVTRKISGKSNECHVFRQVQSCEPAGDIVKFINVGYELPRIK